MEAFFSKRRIEAQREPSMPFGKSAAVTNQGREARSLGPPPPRFSVPSACPGPSWPQGSSRRCLGEQKPWPPSPPLRPLRFCRSPLAHPRMFLSPPFPILARLLSEALCSPHFPTAQSHSPSFKRFTNYPNEVRRDQTLL